MSDYEDFDEDNSVQKSEESEGELASDYEDQVSDGNAKEEEKSNSDSDEDNNSRNSVLEELQEERRQFPNTQRITSPYLSKYEKARVLGVRAAQIAHNSPLYLSVNFSELNGMSPLQIAEMEMAQGTIPLIVRRYFDNGQFQDWKLTQLKQIGP